MSDSVIMPTSLASSSTTGRPPMRLSIMITAAFSTVSPGETVNSVVVMRSFTVISESR